MAAKAKKMTMSVNECEMGMCSHEACHPHRRGKALLSIAIGVLLVMFGFHMIPTIEMLAELLGVVFVLKGGIKLLSC